MSMISLIPNTMRVAKSINPAYTVRIFDQASGLDIIADLPEQISLSFQSEFQNRLPSSGTAELGAPGTAATAADMNYQLRYAADQIWVSTSPIEIPLTILFDAERDAEEEVWVPTTRLEAMALPVDVGYGSVGAPSDGGKTSIMIGQSLIIPNCIITSAHTQYDSRLSKSGYPIAAQTEITAMTRSIISRQELLDMKGVT